VPWLTPVIPTTQEAEIRRITVRSQHWANHSEDPISKKTLHKNRAGGVAQGIGPEFKPQYWKKKKRHIFQTSFGNQNPDPSPGWPRQLLAVTLGSWSLLPGAESLPPSEEEGRGGIGSPPVMKWGTPTPSSKDSSHRGTLRVSWTPVNPTPDPPAEPWQGGDTLLPTKSPWTLVLRGRDGGHHFRLWGWGLTRKPGPC
jgi:hypothetical protein